MYKEIFNNQDTLRFFANTCLAPAPKSFLDELLSIFWPSKIGFKNSNLLFYSDSQYLDDFAFALSAAVALSGRYCAFITPMPGDYGLHCFEPLKGANLRLANEELSILQERLLIVRSGTILPKRGIDFAVVCPASAYIHKLNIPHVLISYNRMLKKGYKLVHFKVLMDSFLLSSSNSQLRHFYLPPNELKFNPNPQSISEQTAVLLKEQKLDVRSKTSRLQELSSLLSVRDIDGLSIKVRPRCSLGIKLHGVTLPVDFSNLDANYVAANFSIKKEPSF